MRSLYKFEYIKKEINLAIAEELSDKNVDLNEFFKLRLDMEIQAY